MRTQVGIVGAGPAGLLLSHLLHLRGVDSVVLEARDRAYVEQRVRAGVLEQGSVELLRAAGLADRLDREALIHHGIEIRYDGWGHRIALTDLTGRAIFVYGQQEVVKDLIAARLADDGPIVFEAQDVAPAGFTTDAPTIRYRADGAQQELRCDLIVGCDGFHGVCRPSIPSEALRIFEHEYPFSWLGILAAVAPSTEELIYAPHERGFALHSLRSPEISRLYLQVANDEDLVAWPDERIWEELAMRLALPGWQLADGPVLEKGISPMRSFVAEPMRYGRLFLAGDAAHIVPATGAKGLNLAVNDVRVLSEAIAEWYATGDERLLDAYSDRVLGRVWRAEHFSQWMSAMLHRYPGDDPFRDRLQRSQLDYVTGSTAAATSLAENYVGMPFD